MRVTLLVLLVLSAVGGLLVQPRVTAAVRGSVLEAAWLAVVPGLFGLLIVVVALDTWRSARKRGFFRGRSVMLVAVCVAFLGVLIPRTFSEYRARTSPPAQGARLATMMAHKDPRVRALVMDAVGWRPGAVDDDAPLLVLGLNDKDPLVVEATLQAIRQKSGEALTAGDALGRAHELVKVWSTH